MRITDKLGSVCKLSISTDIKSCLATMSEVLWSVRLVAGWHRIMVRKKSYFSCRAFSAPIFTYVST